MVFIQPGQEQTYEYSKDGDLQHMAILTINARR